MDKELGKLNFILLIMGTTGHEIRLYLSLTIGEVLLEYRQIIYRMRRLLSEAIPEHLNQRYGGGHQLHL